MTDRARLTVCTGTVWCDFEGELHEDKPDPYEYGVRTTYLGRGGLLEEPYVCEGPHKKLYLFAKPSEGEF